MPDEVYRAETDDQGLLCSQEIANSIGLTISLALAQTASVVRQGVIASLLADFLFEVDPEQRAEALANIAAIALRGCSLLDKNTKSHAPN